MVSRGTRYLLTCFAITNVTVTSWTLRIFAPIPWRVRQTRRGCNERCQRPYAPGWGCPLKGLGCTASHCMSSFLFRFCVFW